MSDAGAHRSGHLTKVQQQRKPGAAVVSAQSMDYGRALIVHALTPKGRPNTLLTPEQLVTQFAVREPRR